MIANATSLWDIMQPLSMYQIQITHRAKLKSAGDAEYTRSVSWVGCTYMVSQKDLDFHCRQLASGQNLIWGQQ